MNRLVIADSHLGQRRGDSAVMAATLAAARERGIGEVVYLGDVFQYLIGLSKFWTDTVRRVIDEWQRAREAGTRIVLVEGNRDFFLDEADLTELVDWAGLAYRFETGGRRFLLVHGDRVNRRDLQYRFWSSVSKSQIARLWARMLPQGTAIRIVEGMERRLAASNRKWRYKIPEDELRRSALEAWEDGVDVVLWGHFHAAWEHRLDDRESRVLPAWLDRNLGLLVGGDGAMTLVDASLEPVSGATAESPGEGRR